MRHQPSLHEHALGQRNSAEEGWSRAERSCKAVQRFVVAVVADPDSRAH